MPWIGVECSVEAWELRKWAAHVEGCGGKGVADLLERCARMVAGQTLGCNSADRLLEVEGRAADAARRMRADAGAKAAEILGRVGIDGVGMGAVMSAAGMDGWRAGSAAGGKNGGCARRERKWRGGAAVAAGVGCVAERGKPPRTVVQTVARDARYGETWEGWAGCELVKRGFKMAHVAKGVGLSVSEAWRHVSGFTKHWRREGLAGRQFPGVPPEWEDRLSEAADRAMNVGVKGTRVVLNGTGDLGVRREA